MTVREYFRQLRREQWELDKGFSSRVHDIFPPSKMMISFCGDRDPFEPGLSAEPFLGLGAAVRVQFRCLAFYALHRDVLIGLVRIAEIVEVEQELSPDAAVEALQAAFAERSRRLKGVVD